MRSKTLIALSCVFIFLLILGNVRSTSAQHLVYSSDVTPSPFFSKSAQWRVTNVTGEAVEFVFGSGTFWQASAYELVIYDIHEIVNNEVHGTFTIGNLTIHANNSRIGYELAFSIWPWFPGLISHLGWASVDQSAVDAATGLMEGELVISTTSTTKSYIYHQGALGNQNTTLVYDRQTGILLEGYSEFFFQNDYHLGVELIGVAQVPTSTFYLIVILIVILVVFVIAQIVIRRLR